MSTLRTLQTKINELTGGLYATWMPDDRATVGDYGSFFDGRLNRHGNLKNKGIEIETYEPFEAEERRGTKKAFRYSDGVSRNNTSSAKAKTTDAIEGRIELNFTKQGAFLYHSQGARYLKLDNRDKIFTNLIKNIALGGIIWDDSYVLVDEAFHCDYSTILISEAKHGFVDISANGNIGDADNLANADGNLRFSVSRGSILNYAGQHNSNPLFHAIRLKFPGGPGDGGGGMVASIADRIKQWLGISYPKPQEIDVSPYRYKTDTYLISHKNTAATMEVTIETVKVEDIFSSDPTAATEDFQSVETVEVTPQQRRAVGEG